ncbi:flagellin [Bacillus mycoides]|uniref:flagellin N-terminal helical domain-containing protein n=2 Tax=Bacillus cereus group TaxID=86661 RepID=UPI0008643146|nr:flagellin [Bacillus mycoides]OFD65588.1 flagellin [Bacillus mycoides]OFD67940.1 flagellin [Bacillus mycoides]OFD98951.1 flagellin [Bacillus mycoides]OHX32509.1 flagellin [Bacillus mycoides]SCM86588.1 Flagellin [Bacillus mycoides]
MRINTNINSMRTQEYMRQNQDKMNTSMNRLSSGKRINSAADDAAGLAIATRMRAKENGLGVASRNTQDGISLIRTADSALNSVSNILLRMRDLAVQSANGTNSVDDQKATNKEFGQLINQIDYIAKNTAFNGTTLLNGATVSGKHEKTSSIAIKTYDDGGAADITISLASASADDLGLMKDDKGTSVPLDVTDSGIITKLDDKLKEIATSRADLGATLNRLDFNVANLNSQASSMASSASQIEDADMAKEMSEMTKFKILNEAGISMLSQANQTPQMVSKLLQ